MLSSTERWKCLPGDLSIRADGVGSISLGDVWIRRCLSQELVAWQIVSPCDHGWGKGFGLFSLGLALPSHHVGMYQGVDVCCLLIPSLTVVLFLVSSHYFFTTCALF